MENIHTYHSEFVILIGHHILVASLKGNVQQPEEELQNQILRVKPFNSKI